jgi:DNA polymerase I-like protein with 3'-5' exonuclease and polymerase domains
MATIDFETEAIVGNPILDPPKPIGVAIRTEEGITKYVPGTPNDLRRVLLEAWNHDNELIFHNAPFDISVAKKWCGLPQPHWSRVHDTTFLVYLENPHAPSLSLKPSANRILGMATDEQDELREWIMENVRGATKNTWGAHICKAPFTLVSKYAKMDVDMTWALFSDLHPRMPRGPYNLERELQPCLVEATQHGIRLDREQLEIDTLYAEIQSKICERMIFENLGQEFDIHNGAQLADALDKAGKVKEWKLTPTGKRSTSRPNLMSCLDDPELLSQLSYAGAIQTCLTTFMRPWSQLASGTGRLHPNWNQVRGEEYGTRTGRLSCDHPNLQNVANEFTFRIPNALSPLPQMRAYLLPEVGDRWYSRDFSGQEMRILGHFENGALLKSFQADPDLDPHQMVKEIIYEQTGLDLPRKTVKGIGFGLIYGMGVPGLSLQLGVKPHEAQEMIMAYHSALPGVSQLQTDTQRRGRYTALAKDVSRAKRQLIKAKKSEDFTPAQIAGYECRHRASLLRMPDQEGITTAWGRKYKVEAPKMSGPRLRTFEYKLLNYLIQGSAADQTKRAMLHWFKNHPTCQTFLATVHDEINISIPDDGVSTDVALQVAMDRKDGLDVPMRSTLKIGTNWGNIQ